MSGRRATAEDAIRAASATQDEDGNYITAPLLPESTWTKPRDWCPAPERWHATDSDSTEVEVSELVGAFVRALQPEVVVETGTAWGQTAQHIGHALQRNGHGRLFTLEVDEYRVKHCRALLAPLPVTVVHGASLEWIPSAPVGFAWFDSLMHLRIPEFLRYRSHLITGSIVGFHDTAPHKGLTTHIEKLERDGYLKAIRMRTPRGVTFAQVT